MIFPNCPCIRYAVFTKLQKNLPASPERARTLPKNKKHSDNISSDKSRYYRCAVALGGRAYPLRHCFAMPPLPKGEALAFRKASSLRQRLSLWESWRGAPERARTLPKNKKHSDNISSDKSRYYRCAVTLGGRACPLRHCFAMPPLPKGEAFLIRTGGTPWSGPARGRRCRLSSRRSARCSRRCSPR